MVRETIGRRNASEIAMASPSDPPTRLSDEELCRCAAKVMATILGGTPRNIDKPDKDSTKKNVDLVCEIDGRRVWFEHTLMPAFENKIRDDIWVTGLADALDAARRERDDLPSGKYWLIVDIGALQGVPAPARKIVAGALVEAVRKHGASLLPVDEAEVRSAATVCLSGIPYLNGIVELERQHDGGEGGTLIELTRNVTGYNADRVKVARKVVDDKVPKLLGSRLDEQDVTVLVVEFCDEQLDSWLAVAKPLRDALEIAALGSPDYIFVVDTTPYWDTSFRIVRDEHGFHQKARPWVATDDGEWSQQN
jgi:hypothetical protein